MFDPEDLTLHVWQTLERPWHWGLRLEYKEHHLDMEVHERDVASSFETLLAWLVDRVVDPEAPFGRQEALLEACPALEAQWFTRLPGLVYRTRFMPSPGFGFFPGS